MAATKTLATLALGLALVTSAFGQTGAAASGSDALNKSDNIFGVGLEKPAPPPPPLPPPPPPQVQVVKEPPKPPEKLPFKLVGTLAGPPAAAVALLENGGKQEAVPLGGTWEQATVTAIQRNRVTIRWKNRTSELEIDYKDWGALAPPAPSLAAPEAAPTPVYTPQGEVPVPESIETRKVPRAQVDRNLQDLASLLSSMRIQPYYENGQPSGFLLTNVRPGSFLDQVGVQNGDILRFVNGQKIDNVQNAFQLYNIFKNSTNVEVTVMRDTKPVTLKYVIE